MRKAFVLREHLAGRRGAVPYAGRYIVRKDFNMVRTYRGTSRRRPLQVKVTLCVIFCFVRTYRGMSRRRPPQNRYNFVRNYNSNYFDRALYAMLIAADLMTEFGFLEGRRRNLRRLPRKRIAPHGLWGAFCRKYTPLKSPCTQC